jgi:hypothetical protein
MTRHEESLFPDQQFVLHIGLSKTGTTTLQQSVFLKHPEIRYLGKDRDMLDIPRECTSLKAHAILNPLLWDHQAPLDASSFLEAMESISEIPLAKTCLWLASWEEFGNRPLRIHLQSLRRIRQVFGTCRMLVCLRNPLDRLPSEYLQELRYRYLELRSDSWRSWFHPFYRSLDCWMRIQRRTGHLQRLLGTGELVRESMAIVGPEHVGVLLYEDFIKDPAKFMNSLSGFLGVEALPALQTLHQESGHLNARMTQGQYQYLRQLQGSLWKRYRCLRQKKRRRRREFTDHGKDGIPERAVLSEKWQQMVANETRQGHRWLAETFQLPLEEYGYPM